jgi:hypothetical protein
MVGRCSRDLPKNGFVEAVYSAGAEDLVPNTGIFRFDADGRLSGQTTAIKAHMPGFIHPQVYRVIYCPAPTLLFVGSCMDYTCLGCKYVYTTFGVNRCQIVRAALHNLQDDHPNTGSREGVSLSY